MSSVLSFLLYFLSFSSFFFFFFFNDTATTEIYTLSYTTLFRSRLGGRPAHRLALLAQQLGVAPREVLFLVLARLVGHRGAQGLEGGLTVSVSPPRRRCGCVAAGEDDCPL